MTTCVINVHYSVTLGVGQVVMAHTTTVHIVLHSQTAFFLLNWGGKKAHPNIKEKKWSGYTRLLYTLVDIKLL